MKDKPILDMLLQTNMSEMDDEELNELRERINKEYDIRQEERRRVVATIRKGYISSYEDL